MAAEPPSPKPGYVPGQKKARHLRFALLVRVLTFAGLLAFVAFAAWGVVALFSRPSPAEVDVENCRTLLRGIATDVGGFRAKRGRLPETLAELRNPELPSRFEAQPRDSWDHPVQYRIVDEAKGEIRLRSLGRDGLPDTPDDIVEVRQYGR